VTPFAAISVSAHVRELLLILLPLLPGAVAVYYLLPRPMGRQVLLGVLLGAFALVAGAMTIVRVDGLSVETVLFYIFSGLAVVAGTLLIGQRNPARAALSFTLVILSSCGLFLLLAAPFLMVATIIIYAGAIIVTFLFVIMLAQQSGISDADDRSREPLLASFTGFVLLAALLYVLRISLLEPVREIDPFLQRIVEARSKSTGTEVRDALARNPEELDHIVMRQWRARKPNADEKQIKAQEDQISRAKFPEKFKLLIDELGGYEDEKRHIFEDSGLQSGWEAWIEKNNMEKLHAHLAVLETFAKQVRQRAGLTMPETVPADVTSSLSGPSSVRTAQLRRNADGRPQAPAENSAYLGKSLFTDYLVPVELGGFLLLVATAGAIAIASRHSAPGRSV
jgi:NADH:ubiquinone oxidoreductase subunit 6 (subunit J)